MTNFKIQPTAPSIWRYPELQFTAALESTWYHRIAKLYSAFYFCSVDFFHTRNYVPALVPITTGSISSPMGLGSDSEPVEILLHNRRTYLADSMQFALEYYLRQGHEGAFYIMPSFRGEDSDARHLNQFYHAEVEMVGGLDNVMSFVEDYVAALCEKMLDCKTDIRYDRLEAYLANSKPTRIEVEDAIADLVEGAGFVRCVASGEMVITAEGERELLQRNGHQAIWLIHPSRKSAPFYQAADLDRPNRALAADLLMGIGEVVGCGERHTRVEDVAASLDLQQVSAEPYDWYLRLKREYPLRTAGFGLGIERLMLWILGHDDIRDIHLVPRLKDGAWPL